MIPTSRAPTVDLTTLCCLPPGLTRARLHGFLQPPGLSSGAGSARELTLLFVCFVLFPGKTIE